MIGQREGERERERDMFVCVMLVRHACSVLGITVGRRPAQNAGINDWAGLWDNGSVHPL